VLKTTPVLRITTSREWSLPLALLATAELRDRCYAMDMKHQVLVIGTAGRHIQIFDLANPTTPHYKSASDPLPFMCSFDYLAHCGVFLLTLSVDGLFASEVANEDDCCVSECWWACARFDRRKSSDPARSFHLSAPSLLYKMHTLSTFRGSRPNTRNLDDKDPE
jgi:mRNA export factor